MALARLTRGVAAGTAAVGAALALLASPAGAATPTQETTHASFDPTGAVFTCLKGDITVTGGTVDQVMHFGQDHRGVFHYTGTITVHNVTATDAAGNQYRISGASWFGGKALSETQPLVATETDHFVIRNVTGGVYAKVQVVDHFSLNGKTFRLDIGGCEEPQD
jgi:hypothetical protein